MRSISHSADIRFNHDSAAVPKRRDTLTLHVLRLDGVQLMVLDLLFDNGVILRGKGLKKACGGLPNGERQDMWKTIFFVWR